MTDTQAPPLPPDPVYLLLIDSRVANYQDIINSKQSGVHHIVFHVPETATSSKALFESVQAQIAELGVPSFTSIGLVQHNDAKPRYEMFGRAFGRMKPVVQGVEAKDPHLETWNQVALFITMLRINYRIQYFDMMACALYSNPDWKYIIDELTKKTGVTVRASTDDTGTAALGGDWFLESHTGVNLKDFYFTEAIENYNGVLVSEPGSGSGSGSIPAKKLILIDSRIKDIPTIINAVNADTYCLVFNYFYDTPATILSKLRFLTGENRYILDHFYYEEPALPTRMDASGNHCTPCDDFDMDSFQLLPTTLQTEYMSYTMDGGENNGQGVWPFYSQSSEITIQKPVFFQRSKVAEESSGETVTSYESTDMSVTALNMNYKARPFVLVSDLDEIYELAQTAGEIAVGDSAVFDCVGIIQHAVPTHNGYKFVDNGGSEPALVRDIQSADPNLSSWADFVRFIQSLKTVFHTSTLDMMACALYSNPDWKYIIDLLAVRENITIRASLDNTGTVLDEGNWILETNDIDLTDVYFTDKIYEWKYVLTTYIDNRFYALRWNNSMYATRSYDARLKIAAGTNNFTIETWYYETAKQTSATIVDMGTYNYTFQVRQSTRNGLAFYNSSTNWLYADSAVVPVAQWSHLAITRSGSTFTFYINGVAKQTFTSAASLFSDNGTFAIGMQSPTGLVGNRLKLDSALYDLRLWSVARTATEIQMNRNRIMPANTTGLVANYLLTDNSGNLNDRTENGLHTAIQTYTAARWSNSTVPIPNIGFLINNGYSLRTDPSGGSLNAIATFDDITYTDFSGVDLSGVNFANADLTGSNFTNANLTNANLTYAVIVGATFTGAITTGSSISLAITSPTNVIQFDGVDDAVFVFTAPTWSYSTQFRTTMTVECWFKTTDTAAQNPYATLVSRNNGGGATSTSQFTIYMAPTGEIWFGLTNTGNTALSYHATTGQYKDANWHHVACTYDSVTGLKRIYIDGVISRTDAVPTGFGLLANDTVTQLVFGSDVRGVNFSDATRQFRGFMSDIRIWNVVRPATDISNNLRQRLIGNETGLVGYWKLHQGYGTGWATLTAVLDSTSNRVHGGTTGAPVSFNWVLSNGGISFQPRISTITLGADTGAFRITDNSFSFIDPSSNSLGDFTYAVSPGTVATVANGASTRKTVYATSGAITIPTLSTFDFPEIASLADWQIDISFTQTTNASSWRALIGDYQNEINTRGWGLWVSNTNRIQWSWTVATAIPTTISVSLNTPYVLTAAQSGGTITLTLRTVSTGVTQTGSFSVGSNIMGKGPVTIGGWRTSATENFTGTISYVNVSVPTNSRVVTLLSLTGETPATLTATQGGLVGFSEGTKSEELIVVASGEATAAPTIGALTVPAKIFGDASFNLTAPTSNSSGAFTYTSSVPSVATVTSGGTVTIVGEGTTTITATQVATASYRTRSVSASFVVSPAVPTIVAQTNYIKNLVDASFNIAPTSNSSGAFAYTSSVTSVATVTSGGMVTIVGMGTTVITTTQAAIANYTAGSAVTSTIVVSFNKPYVLQMNGTNNGVNLGVPAWSYSTQFRTTMTVECWFKTTDTNNQRTWSTLVSRWFGGGNASTSVFNLFMAPTGTINAHLTNGSGTLLSFASTTTYKDTLWHHAAMTYNSATGVLVLYIDGVLNGSATSASFGALSTTSNTSTRVVFGSDDAGITSQTDRQFRGFLSDIRIWNTVRSATDISNNMNRRLVGNETGLVGYWKINQGYGTGWGVTLTGVSDSTANRSSGTIVGTVAWVLSTGSLSFQPDVSALTLGPNNGVYALLDSSFSFTDPSSNSLGDFTYTVSPGTVATVTNVASTRKTIYATSGAITIPTLTTFDFPEIASLPSWQIDISFTSTASGGSFSKLLVGDMQNEVNTNPTGTTNRGWNILLATDSKLVWGSRLLAEDRILGFSSIVLNTPYVLSVSHSGGVITATLLRVSTQVTETDSFAHSNNLIGRGPVTIGGVRETTNPTFVGTISYVNVSVPTNSRVVTLLSSTGETPATVTATQGGFIGLETTTKSASLVVTATVPTIGALTVPAKNFGDASFNLTAPTSNSTGAFTYTSSAEGVATVTSGGTVTIVGAGSTTITATQAASGNYAGGSSVTALFVVSPIAPTIGALSAPTKNFGDASFNLTAPTSNSGGAFTYTSSVAGVATVTSGGTVTIVGAGTTTITATQASTTNYTGGSVTASLVVSPIAPTIGALSAPAKNFGDAAFDLTAPTSNSGGAFTYTSSAEGVATVTSGGTVTIVGAGSTTITATQASTTNYTGGSVTASLVVSPIAPTIGALSAPAKNFGDASFNLATPTSNSGGAFTYTSSAEGVATVTSGGTVTIIGAGSTTITATQASTTNYTGGSVTASLVVSPIAPTIGALTAPAKNFGDASFNLTAPTSNSGGAFTYTSSAEGVATVTSGGTVTIVGAGTTTITATQASTTNYTGGSVTASLVVSPIAPTIGALSAPAKNFGDASFNLIAPSSNSAGAFTYTSSVAGVATVTSGGTVTIVGSGSTTITATQASTTNYTGGSVTASLVVSPIAPTIGALSAPAKNFGDAAFNLIAPTSTSGGAFTYTSSAEGVATVTSGGTVTVVGSGTTTITATQALTTNYLGGSVTASLVVSPIAPTIGALTAPAKNFGDASFNLASPTSNSGGAITYTSSAAGVATVTSGGTVTVVGAGTTTITATQASTTNYTGGSVTASLVVSPIAPTIGALTAPAKNFGDASFNLIAPASTSGGAFTYTSSAEGIATVTSGGTVTIIGAGSATITATQAASADGNYTSGSVTASLVISSIAPTIGALTAPAKSFGDASFNLTAPTSTSGGAFTYTSSAPAVATVTSEGTVTIIGAGSTTITATQASTTNYLGGSVTASLVVSPIAPTIGALTAPAKNFGDASFNLTAPSSNSGGAITYTSSAPSVATVTSGGTVTIIGAGSTTITATQASTTNYTGGSVTASLVVSPIAPTYQSISQITKTYSTDVSFSLTSVMSGVSNSSGAYTFSSASAAIDICGGVATILAYTPSAITITATQAASGNYNASGSTTFAVLVNRKTPSYGAFSVPAATYEDEPFSIAAYAPTTDSTGVSFTYTSSEPTVATINSAGTVVTIIGQGYTTITASQVAGGNYAAGSVTTSFLVNRAAPTFLKAFTISDKTFGDASFSLLPFTEGLDNTDGTYHFTSSNSQLVSISEVDGVTTTILAYTPTPITIYVAIDACGNYAASSTSGTLTVARAAPTIGALTAPAKNFGDAAFDLTAPTSNSGGAFTYTSSAEGVATVTSGGRVTIVGAGSTTITATQDASGNYAGGSPVTASLVVSPIAPTIGVLTAPAKNFGDASFNLASPTSNSGGAITYTSSAAGVATVTSGGMVTIIGAGTTTITATQASTTNYTGGSSVTASLVVSPIAPTIGALTAPAKNFGDASFNLASPTSNSGGAITYTSSAAGVATVTSGGTVTIIGAGTTTITATQASTTNYTGGSVTASLVVSSIAPTIGALTAPAKNFGAEPFDLTAPTSNSTGAFTYTSSAEGVATVTSGGRVTIVGAGSTTITATQSASADGNYTGGSSVTASLVVSASLSNFTIPSGKKYGDAPFDLTDPTTVDNTVGFTFTSSTPAVATISGRTVTIVSAGSSVITATQAATANRAQLDISATLVIARITPVITLASITKSYGDASFRLTPTSTNTDDASGATLSFTSSNPDVASIVDTSFVSINGVGTATITISQAAATTNFTDGSGSVVITVNKGTLVLSTFSVNANKTYGSSPFSVLVAPTSASAGAITYSSSDVNVATIDNSGVITLVAAGYVNFTATQVATALYNSVTKTSNTMTVHRQAIALTRVSPSLEVVNKTYGDEYFIVSATNASSGALTYESDTPSVAGVINASTGVISVVSVGTATITARRAQTAQYTSDPVSWTIQVARTTTTLTGLSDLTRNVTVAPFAVTATSASNGAVSYALQDPSSPILTIHPTTGIVRLLSPGSAVIVASQAQGTLYEAPAPITATITVTPAGNALEGTTLTSTTNYAVVDLNGANINNANITSSNFAGAKLSGSTFTGATITNANFTNASLVGANLSGATIKSTDFTNADLSGATLTGIDASGTIFTSASLANVNLSGANVTNVNFTNTSIKGANITDVTFTPLQKLQLLKNSDNRDITAIAISSVSGPTILAAISESSPVRTIANLDLASATSSSSVAVIIPQTSTTPDGPITDVILDVATYTKFYLPINENEYFRINGVIYYSSSNVVRKYTTNEIIEVITYDDKPVWLFVGSIIGLVLQTNTMNASSFVVPATKLSTDTTPFMPTTLPTSNSNSPIVYSSSNTHLATINATTGEITITGNGNGLVSFTATQVQNATYGPATIASNTLLIDQYLHFSLVGLNQSFNLTTLASLDTLNLIADTTDATAVFYVRLSDMTDIFKYQSDAIDVNDVNATDLKYYVFNRKWPAELKINPSHAMLNKADSTGMLGTTELFAESKMLVKHDFVRYLALKLFNTIHGVDLFKNETDLQENATYYGESIRHNIQEIMSGISTTSGDEGMAYDASGNKYLTNSASGNTNLCRELMRQISASVASRYYNNGADNTGMKTVPLREEDTITFKVTIQAAATQNVLTGVSEIPSRSYTIKLVLKSSVTNVTNPNTVISDSEMFPNSYPYSSSVTSIAPDSEAAATVYNIYSPPAPIPFTRFGYDGWYYTNSSAWVDVNSGVRNHVKWLVAANRVGSSTVGALQYIRMNLKIHNKTAVPYLMVYTQSGSWRKYIVSGGGGGSLTNGTKYSFYMNFNSYSREPAMIGYTNKDLVISVGSGAFASNEVITNIALETDSGATAGSVEFTLASIIVGEIASGVPSEKEYGFMAMVPSAYP